MFFNSATETRHICDCQFQTPGSQVPFPIDYLDFFDDTPAHWLDFLSGRKPTISGYCCSVFP